MALALAKSENKNGIQIHGHRYSTEQIALIKSQVAPNCTDAELSLFLYQCQRTQLDPLTRQIYAIKRGGRMTIQTSIDGQRLIAERTGKYEGQTPVYWCGIDGQWVDVWLDDKPPIAAKVGIFRNGFRDAVWAVARWKEYNPGQSPMWQKMDALMIGKCAESLGLRKAFPQELSGLYTTEEMEQADIYQAKEKTAAQDRPGFSTGIPFEQHMANLESKTAATVSESVTSEVPTAEPIAGEEKKSQVDLGAITVTIIAGQILSTGKTRGKPWTLYEMETKEKGKLTTFSQSVYDICGEACTKAIPIILHVEPTPKGPTVTDAEWPEA
jgi:phage recombination protein Bet